MRASAPGTDHGIQQTPRRHAIAELQTIGEQVAHTQMFRQRAHYVVQPLADQHYLGAALQQFVQLRYAMRLELRFETILEVLSSEQIKAVAADAA